MAARVAPPPPYGYRLELRRELIPVRSEQHVLWLCAWLRQRGWSLQKIADQLNELGLRTRADLPWTRQAVHLVVRREAAAEELADTG